MSQYATIARPYAKAAFEFAKEHKAIDEWMSMIGFLKEVVSNSEVTRLIQSSGSNSSVLNLLEKISHDFIDEYCLNFLRVIVENDRLPVIPDIFEEFIILKNEDENIINAEIVSAEKLPSDELVRLNNFLNDKYQAKVNVVNTIDQDILGGIIIKTPNEVIDASIKGKIDELAAVLKS